MAGKRLKLTDEQQLFIARARSGENVLVDACIGSGKTTAINRLCDELPVNKKILYLTYNRLLKLDAREKIKNYNVTVTNYHGFAYAELERAGIKAGVGDLIQVFNAEKPKLPRIDVLIIDEYQDIEQELADMLEYIKSSNPKMQIVAVGDMEQKIYDKTTLNVAQFMEGFMGKHIKLEFTRCFRLPKEYAEMLGRIWNKSIVGVNEDCEVVDMDEDEAIAYLAEQKTGDILCLGQRTGRIAYILNQLEYNYPEKFNKNTVFASISDIGDGTSGVRPNKDSAIFTTFDSSKGLERKVCLLADFTESYWQTRIDKPQQSYEILRNVFCVAASRGKGRIIFLRSAEEKLSEKTLSTRPIERAEYKNAEISTMFDFKYKEDVEACYRLLKIKPLPKTEPNIEPKTEPNIAADQQTNQQPAQQINQQNVPQAGEEIFIKNSDGLIDLSLCIGIFQEAAYFDGYDINADIDLYFDLNKEKSYLYNAEVLGYDLEDKILFLTALQTGQNRYREQVKTPFVGRYERQRIEARMSRRFGRGEEVQKMCKIDFPLGWYRAGFSAIGYADVVKDDTVYELKFVSELSHEHYLQCACYVLALKLKRGILWNVRKDEIYEIIIPNPRAFLDATARAITKGALTKFYGKI